MNDMAGAADPVEVYRRIRGEYAGVLEPSESDDDRTLCIKGTVSRLPEVDRMLLYLYAECRSYRTLGELLGVSHSTMRKEIQRIRKEIGDADDIL